MRPMLTPEFENLYNEYLDAESTEDRKIKLRLDAIVNCYKECNPTERVFADEITNEFCRLVSLIKEQRKKDNHSKPQRDDYISYSADTGMNKDDYMPFADSIELLDAFYEHFKDNMVEITLKDYVARINTFAYSDKYLGQMLTNGDLGVREIHIDPVLFTYMNIELIMARFNTKDENGNSVKQRLNIRSALRKLNEFKLETKISKE